MQTELTLLESQFAAASSRWPNLEHWLVTWPEAEPKPEIPMQIGGVGVDAPEGELHWVATGYGSSCDSPARRYRSGFAGMSMLRRKFGKLGAMDWRELTSVDIEAWERLDVLAHEAARQIPAGAVSPDSAIWLKCRLVGWLLAVHELIDERAEQLAGYDETYRVSKLRDVFLASAKACRILMQKQNLHPKAPNARLLIDLAKRTATLDGKPLDVKSETALRWLRVLAEHPGEWMSGSEVSEHDALATGRSDHLRKRLPPEIDALIDSRTGAGSRLRLT